MYALRNIDRADEAALLASAMLPIAGGIRSRPRQARATETDRVARMIAKRDLKS